jgi:hypothetical protein
MQNDILKKSLKINVGLIVASVIFLLLFIFNYFVYILSYFLSFSSEGLSVFYPRSVKEIIYLLVASMLIITGILLALFVVLKGKYKLRFIPVIASISGIFYLIICDLLDIIFYKSFPFISGFRYIVDDLRYGRYSFKDLFVNSGLNSDMMSLIFAISLAILSIGGFMFANRISSIIGAALGIITCILNFFIVFINNFVIYFEYGFYFNLITLFSYRLMWISIFASLLICSLICAGQKDLMK